MSVVQKVIDAAVSGDEEKFESLIMRLGYEINPVSYINGLGLAPLSMILPQICDVESFCAVCEMAMNMKNGMIFRSELSPVKKEAFVVVLCITAALHHDNEKMMAQIPRLLNGFLDRAAQKNNHSADEALFLKSSVVRFWLSQSKLFDWENHGWLYEQIMPEQSEKHDHLIASMCSLKGNAQILHLLHSLNRLSEKSVVFHVFSSINKMLDGLKKELTDDDRTIASYISGEVLWDALIHPDKDMFAKSSLGDALHAWAHNPSHLLSLSPAHQKFFPIFLNIVGAPPSARHLDILESRTTPEAVQVIEGLQEFVQKQRLLQSLSPKEYPSSHKKLM